jgi:hypothetical protein
LHDLHKKDCRIPDTSQLHDCHKKDNPAKFGISVALEATTTSKDVLARHPAPGIQPFFKTKLQYREPFFTPRSCAAGAGGVTDVKTCIGATA